MPNPRRTTWTTPYSWRGCLAFSLPCGPEEESGETQTERVEHEAEGGRRDSRSNSFSVDLHSLMFLHSGGLAL